MDYHLNANGGWSRLFRVVSWEIAILSILWIGHPRLNLASKNVSEQDFIEAEIEVVYRFYRLQHYPEIWG